MGKVELKEIYDKQGRLIKKIIGNPYFSNNMKPGSRALTKETFEAAWKEMTSPENLERSRKAEAHRSLMISAGMEILSLALERKLITEKQFIHLMYITQFEGVLITSEEVGEILDPVAKEVGKRYEQAFKNLE